jgi:hypothetical protein
MIRQQINECLVGFEQRFVLRELCRIIKLPEVFGLLCELFPLNQSIPLVCDYLSSSRIEGRQ